MKVRTAIGFFGLILLAGGEAHAALISYWAAEGDAIDSVGPNSGTLVNGVTFAPGFIGQGFSFDGTSYVQAPTIGMPTGNQDRTINLWFRINSYAEPPFEEAFLAGYGAFGSFGATYLLTVSHWSFISGPQGDKAVWSQWGSSIAGGSAIQTGTWHNLGVTTVGNFATLYLDGLVIATGTVPFNTPPGTNFVIGRVPGALGNIRWLDGFVDEIRVYDTALSASEMQELAMIPEPATSLLVLTGLVGLAASRRARF